MDAEETRSKAPPSVSPTPLSTKRREGRKDDMTRGNIKDMTRDANKSTARTITEYVKHSPKNGRVFFIFSTSTARCA
jgi:hypothetical protein